MSRLANKPIQIPAGVDVKIDGHKITVKGKRGELTKDFFDYIIFELEGNALWIKPPKIESSIQKLIMKFENY